MCITVTFTENACTNLYIYCLMLMLLFFAMCIIQFPPPIMILPDLNIQNQIFTIPTYLPNFIIRSCGFCIIIFIFLDSLKLLEEEKKRKRT
jgi:hypothetical protein